MLKRRVFSLAFFFALFFTAGMARGAASPDFSFDKINGDFAVFQEGVQAIIAGRGKAGASLSIKIGDLQRTVVVESNGRWRVSFPPLAANRTYSIVLVSNGIEVARAENVVVGEVWLCSGQSNMEMSVAANGYFPPEKGYFDGVREFAVKPQVALGALDESESVSGWQTAGSTAYRRFSAACAFFARERSVKTGKPVGVILAAIGSTSITAWVPPAGRAGGVGSTQSAADSSGAVPVEAVARYVSVVARSLGVHDSIELLSSRSWQPSSSRPRNSTSVWYRAEFAVPHSAADTGLRLEIPPISGLDVVWVNGQLIGSSSQPSPMSRRYAVPASSLKGGRADVVIFHVHLNSGDELSTANSPTLGGGERVISPAQMEFSRDVGLNVPPLPAWHFGLLPAGAWNAMLAPISQIPTRGFIWYQGEGNGRDVDETYASMLTAILAAYRKTSPSRLAVVVQLPGYSPNPPTPGGFGWSRVREQQRKVASLDALTALVVTMDLGQEKELHPKNKRQIGMRIARAVSSLENSRKPAGTQFSPEVSSRGEASVLALKGDSGRLSISGDSGGVRGFELCDSERRQCESLKATVSDGNFIQLDVRRWPSSKTLFFCWGDYPDCNLLSDGLPVTPFFVQ